MLRKRSRAGTTKQALMADYSSLQSPTSTSLFASPRLFTSFVSVSSADSESMMSPTSILDSKPFSAFTNSFWSDKSSPKPPKPEHKLNRDKLHSRGVGLGLVDALSEEDFDSKVAKPDSRMVLFGSQLKIQIPLLYSSPVNSPNSHPEFGIKTRNAHVGPFSPGSSSSFKKPPFGSPHSGMDNTNSPRVVGPLSASEMELFEEYTCVISHGPNPRTTHIFDDRIVESCSGVSRFSESIKENRVLANCSMNYPSENSLSFCHYCKKNLDHVNDIYMYRGEKAFCSSDCRYREIMRLEKGLDSPEFDDLDGTPPQET